MPYRNAHFWLLALLPAVGLAFWPSYFGRLGSVSWVLHAHGITATLWIVLAAFQSWSVGRVDRSLHRVVGRASLALFPLFWASGLLIVHVMAAGFAIKDNPFHALFGARLVPVDALTSVAVLILYYVALSRRRMVLAHAPAMLAIPLFLLPPIVVRIMQIAGPLAIQGPAEFYKFGYGLEICNLVSIVIAVWAWSRRRATGWPFLFTAAVIVLQSVAFEIVGRTPGWERAMVPLAALPTGLIAVAAIVVAGCVTWLGWSRPLQGRATNVRVGAAASPAPELG